MPVRAAPLQSYNPTVRLFFCVELEESVREALGQLARAVRARFSQGSWVAQDNLHITLRFLGEVEERRLGELTQLGQALAQAHRPFTLTLDQWGAFPAPRRARVLWVGPGRPVREFAQLAEDCEQEVQKLGFPPERNAAVPHVTLARFRQPADVQAVLQTVFSPIPVRVDAVTLMRSELRPQGPRYTPVARWDLQG